MVVVSPPPPVTLGAHADALDGAEAGIAGRLADMDTNGDGKARATRPRPLVLPELRARGQTVPLLDTQQRELASHPKLGPAFTRREECTRFLGFIRLF